MMSRSPPHSTVIGLAAAISLVGSSCSESAQFLQSPVTWICPGKKAPVGHIWRAIARLSMLVRHEDAKREYAYEWLLRAHLKHRNGSEADIGPCSAG